MLSVAGPREIFGGMLPREYGVGDVVGGRFRLAARLGAGGMGAVWRARHEQLGIDVALKQISVPRDVPENEYRERVTRALREGKTLARLPSHPHIVGVRDLIEEEGVPWLVMDLVEGRSLTEVVRQDGLMSVARVVRMAQQLAGALKVVHENDVLHRDIKPDNVMVTAEGNAVLVDFGIAVHADDQTLTSSGVFVGTPDYVDPERINGKPLRPASDLFCLAATLYFAVEGRSPFRRDNIAATFQAILVQRPVPMQHAGPLSPLLTDMLDPDPDRRPKTHEILDQLRRISSAANASTRTKTSRPRSAGRKPSNGITRPPTAVDRSGNRENAPTTRQSSATDRLETSSTTSSRQDVGADGLRRIGLALGRGFLILPASLPITFPLLASAGSGHAIPYFQIWTYFSGDSPLMIAALVMVWIADAGAVAYLFDISEGSFFTAVCGILAAAWLSSHLGAFLHGAPVITDWGTFIGGLPGIHLP